jgi:hypothetical protein
MKFAARTSRQLLVAKLHCLAGRIVGAVHRLPPARAIAVRPSRSCC